ncbi:MAG: alpha-L-fucosidase [Lentisphaeria bacterium]|nr:alpha-L-fucosidase [Lentisphaeria bacterium]
MGNHRNGELGRWQESRFGMFIHFGLYSVAAGVWKGKEQGRNRYAEWIKYQALWPCGGVIPDDEYNAQASRLTLEHFDAGEWVREAKNAGMGYIVVTAKHHDGFAMYDSKVSDYNIRKMTPSGRDFLRELKEACDRHGILLGAYYSHWLDWEFPGGGLPLWPEIPEDPPLEQPSDAAFEGYFTRKCLPQVTELMDDYGIRLFWFDNWCKAPLLTAERLERLIALVHSRGGLVNSRIGVTWNHPLGNDAGIDYLSMGDNEFPDRTIHRPWETSGTFNGSWGFHRLDHRWKTTDHLLRCLISNASRNGNYQLNVGPRPDGTMPPPSIRRLREIGAWMKVNGESIRNTNDAPLPEPAWGRLTLGKDGTLYAHVFENHPACELVIEGVAGAPVSAQILETGQEAPFHFCSGRLSLRMPPESLNSPLNVVRIGFREP